MSNTIGNKQFLDETGLRKVFTLIKSYFEKYVTKKDFEDTELSVSAALNDLNQRIENINVPDTSSFTTKVYVDTEVDILDSKIDNVEEKLEEQIKNITHPEDKIQGITVDGTEIIPNEEGIVNITLPDTSNFVTNEDLNEIKDDISTTIETINSDIDKIKEDISNLDIDTTDLASIEYVDNEILAVKDLIPTVPEQLKAGNNITINNSKINAEGYIYIKEKNINNSISLNGSESLNSAKGNFTTVCGWNCSTDEGDKSSNSFCGGDKSTVSHQVCFAYGEGLHTESNHHTVIGKYNKGYSTYTNPAVFEIGYGSGQYNTKSIFLVDSTGYCETRYYGTKNADFAEYFEWYDGNINNEDRVGYMVQVNSNKIELADSLSKCIGIVTGTGAIICNSASLDWQGRYLKDEWGRPIFIKNEKGELVEQENPEYDPTQIYIPRANRKEWSPVGLIGQIRVRQDGTLKVGGFAGCKHGIATDAAKGYRVLSIINENIALVLVK